jgi:vacuolar protein sorting-associated protein 35
MHAQDFAEEQGLVARLIHRLCSADPGQHYALLQAVRARLAASGPARLRHTLPPIAFAALDIVRRLGERAREPSQEQVCQKRDQLDSC